jgi:hypothetical protein
MLALAQRYSSISMSKVARLDVPNLLEHVMARGIEAERASGTKSTERNFSGGFQRC